MSEADGPVADRVIHIADLHFWHVERNPLRLLNKRILGNFNVWMRRRWEFAMVRAEEFAAYAVSHGIHRLVLTGDFTSTALDSEFAMARTFVDNLRNKGMDIALMAGNHDVYTFESARTKRFERHFEAYLPEGGYPALEYLDGGTPMILAPTACPNLISSRGRITHDEIDRVRTLLANVSGPTIVAAHYPVLNDTYGYTVSKERSLRNAEALRQVLGETEVPLLFVCGHVHRFSHVVDPDFPHVQHLSTGAFFRIDEERNRHAEFTEIHVTDTGFRIYHHVFEDGWQRHEVAPRAPDAPLRR